MKAIIATTRLAFSLFLVTVFGGIYAGTACGHSLPYAISFVMFDSDDRAYRVLTSFHIASYLYESGSQEPSPQLIDRILNLTEQEYWVLASKAERRFASEVKVNIDGEMAKVASVQFPSLVDLQADVAPLQGVQQLPRVIVSGPKPKSSSKISITYPEMIGEVQMTIIVPGLPNSVQLLRAGSPSLQYDISIPKLRDSQETDQLSPDTLDIAFSYLVLGYTHVIPKGLDHILFILGLFFLSTKMAPLLYQVTAFTLAHSITLILSVTGWLTFPVSVVEPLIAASIVYVAIENIYTTKINPWRTAVVFLFGLLHGMGFASVLLGLGLPDGGVGIPLLSFNVGVELAQITVILLAFVALYCCRNADWYRKIIAIPCSIMIASMGFYWVVERTVL